MTSVRSFLRRFGPVALVALGACGNLTAGGFGEAVVVVSGDDPSTLQAASPAPALAVLASDELSDPIASATGPHLAEGTDHPEGELGAELLPYLVSESGAVVPLSDEVLEIKVDLEGVEQEESAPRTLPADLYTELRLVFLKIEAEVSAGLVIGGDTITGPIDVQLESDSLIVSRPISLDLSADQRVELFVDLNAGSWLMAVDTATLRVTASAFADLVTVTVR